MSTTPTASPAPPRVRWTKFWLALGGLAAAALLSTCLVTVDETEFVIVERLGTIVAVYDSPASRGPHFKLPWPIEVARRFDRRIQFFDPPGREVFTRDKKNIMVNAYVNWRIAEPADPQAALTEHPVVKFYRGLGTPETAESRLETRLAVLRFR